ncbi:hypothetical protein [Paenibacillus periandrae]|uniref:hypothetical protein n=1 Tax=Paenibacillus periandrae TaxID=1761741 RepID=UPI001F0982C1|nr:hypothetical protein [Paenibacillus periandrae]
MFKLWLSTVLKIILRQVLVLASIILLYTFLCGFGTSQQAAAAVFFVFIVGLWIFIDLYSPHKLRKGNDQHDL